MNDLEFQGYEKTPFLAKIISFEKGFVYLYRNGAILQCKVDPSSGKYIIDPETNEKIMTLPDFYQSPYNRMQPYLKNNYAKRDISKDPVIQEMNKTAEEEKNNDAAWEDYKQKNPMRTGLGLVNKESFTRKQANGSSWWPFGGKRKRQRKRKRTKKHKTISYKK